MVVQAAQCEHHETAVPAICGSCVKLRQLETKYAGACRLKLEVFQADCGRTTRSTTCDEYLKKLIYSCTGIVRLKDGRKAAAAIIQDLRAQFAQMESNVVPWRYLLYLCTIELLCHVAVAFSASQLTN